MISGATGAMGVVVVALVADHGIGYLFPAVVLCGLLQMTAGFLKLGKKLHLRHQSEDCRNLLHRAGDLVEVNISEDPHYHVATDHA